MSNNTPIAISSPYHLGPAGDPIEIYRGRIEIESAGYESFQESIVQLEWLPRPHVSVNCQGSMSPTNFLDPPGSLIVKFPELGPSLSTRMLKFSSLKNHCHMSFVALSNLGIGQNAEFSYVLFHVLNLREYHGGEVIMHQSNEGYSTGSRMTLEAEGWKVSIDSLENQREAIRSLKNAGGYAITYVGRIERTDQSLFSVSDIEDALAFLADFLSFINGDRCSLVLPIAYDASNSVLWRGWNWGTDAPWLGKPSWSQDLPARCFSPAFPGFMSRWRDADWHEPIKLAIEWFLQAKRGTPEGALILGQSALELLAWVQFVETGSIDPSEFEALKASDRIRRLLNAHSVAASIPTPLSELLSIRINGQSFEDGPHAITAIRNGIVHPKKAKRMRVLGPDSLARRQAANLGLYYLECVMLGLFDYNTMNFIPANTLFHNY